MGLLIKYEPFKSMLLDQIDAGAVARFVEWRKGCARVKVIRKSKGRVGVRRDQALSQRVRD